MSLWKRKNVNIFALGAVCLVGIFSDFGADVDFEGRKLQLDQSAAPAKGMSKAQSGLSEAEWTAFTTIDSQPGCKNENSCNQCRGACGNDDDCYGILKCQPREGASNPVPGCIVPDGGFSGSVCYNPESEYYPPSPDPPNTLVSSYSPTCSTAAPCDVCGGMCNIGQDDQCAGDLRCSYFNNKWPTGRKNCAYNGVKSTKRGYCMPAEDFVEPTSNDPTPSPDWDPSVPDRGELIILPTCPPEGCPVCAAPYNNQDGCTADNQCAADLVCYNEHTRADTRQEQVSGCSSNKSWRYGYCYTKDPLYQPPEIKHLETPPSNDNFVLTNEIAAPEECAIYAVDPDSTFDVPIGGASDVSLKQVLFHKVTYIYVVDASKSTKTFQANADCGDGNSDLGVKHVIDCEILAIQTANEAANAGGNVDLVGLVKFNNEAEIMQGLIEPWAKVSPERRDAAVVEVLRTITPKEATNFEAGVEQACVLARDPKNDNEQTVVIFVSDGAPNLGVTSKNTIMNNCGGAIFQTYAVTEDADCDMVDEANLRPGIDNPDTLREISTFSGGTCTQVPDVSKLPDLLVQLEKTTWDGVVVMVNGVAERNATVNYSKQPSFDAPGSVTYSGTVPLPPGEHKVCLQARSSTSGVVDTAETCKMVVIEAIEASPGFQTVLTGNDATFEVRFVGLKPGCDSFEGKGITVELCDGSKVITKTATNAEGVVNVVVPAEPGAKETCYKVCHTAANGSTSCTTTTVEYEEPKTAPPVPYPTAPPVATKPPVPAETKPPVPAPTPPPIDGGVNGDPLIMGLSGQLFKFDGRNGAWYSAVSTPSFQWNMKINSYETCPNHSDTFVSGAGFTFFDNGKVDKRIEVNVVNNYNVDVGCGSDAQNCLGFGSLELIIDGVKHVVGGDYHTNDGSARITAFNTFYQCSRKWYDFDVRPESATSDPSLRSGRSLSTPSVFELIGGLKDTMIDHEECQKWINDRQAYGDLFLQPGHYSTIIINTADITLHLEYKQENQRCNAHSIDVWISSVSPKLLDEPWEGVIGETKDPRYVSIGEPLMVDRSVALKHAGDKDYEVNSPFSTKCKGCNHK